MREETIQFFSDEEEDFVNLLTEAGTGKSVARVLVFLVHTQEATSHEVERGTDLRQPEVSLAMKYLLERGWITVREVNPGRGRPTKVYALAMPIHGILDRIGSEMEDALKEELARIRALKEYL